MAVCLSCLKITFPVSYYSSGSFSVCLLFLSFVCLLAISVPPLLSVLLALLLSSLFLIFPLCCTRFTMEDIYAFLSCLRNSVFLPASICFFESVCLFLDLIISISLSVFDSVILLSQLLGLSISRSVSQPAYPSVLFFCACVCALARPASCLSVLSAHLYFLVMISLFFSLLACRLSLFVSLSILFLFIHSLTHPLTQLLTRSRLYCLYLFSIFSLSFTKV